MWLLALGFGRHTQALKALGAFSLNIRSRASWDATTDGRRDRHMDCSQWRPNLHHVTGHGVVTPPGLAVEETHVITGGTGRFEGASGRIILARSINLQTLISSASITGTISLDH
jgi:hypothetical protein